MSKKRIKNTKTKGASNTRKKESSKNFKSKINSRESTTNQNDSTNQKILLKKEFINLEKLFIERAKFDFYLKFATQGFQDAKKLPELVNSIIEDPNLLTTFGEVLLGKSTDFKHPFLLPKVNISEDINLTKDIRNISYVLFQDTSA